MPKSKPIAICITDTHMAENNIPLVQSIFRQAFDACDANGVNLIIHAGDWFNSRASQPLACLTSMQEVLDEAAKRNIRIAGIQGNHDKTDLSSPKGYMSVFKHHPALQLFEEETWMYCGKTINLCFLPYFTEGVEYLVRLEALITSINKLSGKKVLFTHTSINGVFNNDGTFVNEDNDVMYFEAFDLTMVGHYHDYQEIGDSIVYFGSSHQANFGEDVNKGFAILYDDLTIERIQAVFPVYRKMYIPATDKVRALHEAQEWHGSTDKIRYIFTGKQEDIDKIDPNYFYSVGIDVKFEAEERKVSFEKIEDATMVVLDKKNMAKSWMEYAKMIDMTSEKKSKGLRMLTTQKV